MAGEIQELFLCTEEENRREREEERGQHEEEKRKQEELCSIEEEKKMAEEEAMRKEDEERQQRELERQRKEAEEEKVHEAERVKREQEEKERLLAEQEVMKQKLEAYKHKHNLTNERNMILFGCDQKMDWPKSHPNATVEEIDEKRCELEDTVAPILNRVAKKNELRDLIRDTRMRLEEDRYDRNDMP